MPIAAGDALDPGEAGHEVAQTAVQILGGHSRELDEKSVRAVPSESRVSGPALGASAALMAHRLGGGGSGLGLPHLDAARNS